MSVTIRKPKAPEKGSLVVGCSFEDEDGNAVSPKSINWTFTDKNGSAINSRDAVAVTSPATSIDVLLMGDDLAILSDESHLPEVERYFLINYVYDSDLQADISQNEQLKIIVENLAHPAIT